MGEREGTSGNPLYDFHGLCVLHRVQVIAKLRDRLQFLWGHRLSCEEDVTTLTVLISGQVPPQGQCVSN
jgi:hypothetical protein